jgi:hypothetical protein
MYPFEKNIDHRVHIVDAGRRCDPAGNELRCREVLFEGLKLGSRGDLDAAGFSHDDSAAWPSTAPDRALRKRELQVGSRFFCPLWKLGSLTIPLNECNVFSTTTAEQAPPTSFLRNLDDAPAGVCSGRIVDHS